MINEADSNVLCIAYAQLPFLNGIWWQLGTYMSGSIEYTKLRSMKPSKVTDLFIFKFGVGNVYNEEEIFF